MSERTLLTPAEAMLLIEPHGSTGTKCVQASLVSLVAAGHLAIREEKNFFSTKRALVARDPPSLAEPLPMHVLAVKHLVTAYARDRMLEQDRFNRALHSAFGSSYRRYVHEEVAPGLVRRGLLTRTDDTILWVFPRIIYERTRAGERLAEPLLRLREELDDIPHLIRKDPDEALRIARAAGVLLLISPQARGQIEKLRKLLAQRPDDGGGGASAGGESGGGSSTDEKAATCEVGYDFGDLSLAMEMDGMLSTIDAVGDCSDGGGGGSDGGGDGGGGD